jgi:ribonuclease BN (tRNA processing enzyme)
MRLVVIGCAGSVAGPELPASCYVVEAEGGDRTWRVALDVGSGSFGPLRGVMDPAELDGVFISHGHPDHCADLTALSVWLRYGPPAQTPREPMPLFGPEGIDRRLRELEGDIADADGPSADSGPFAWQEMAPGDSVQIGPFTVTAFEAWHPVPALAYRITGPASGGGEAVITFTGDTDLSETVVEAARDADLVLAEAGWAHREVNPPGIHMTGAQAGELARRAGATHLVVTHVASWVDPAETLIQACGFHSDAVLAMPGVVFTV